MISSVVITNDAQKELKNGKQWFYKGDIEGRLPNFAGLVRVLNKKRLFLGWAFFSPLGRYPLRLITTTDEIIDKEFWRKGIKLAYAKRKRLALQADAFRVVHAESDSMPSVVIDKYNDIWSFKITSAGAETIKKDLVDIIIEEFHPSAIVEKNKSAVRKREGLPQIEKIVYGRRRATIVREGMRSFEVDVLSGQKTGAYLDYRSLRFKAGEFARGLNDVLDGFCYQGWTACHMASAKKVVAVDSSKAALESAARNAKLGNHDNIEFVEADVFDWLPNCGRKFDLIHLDPPSFSKEGHNLASAILGYRKLVRMSIPLLKKGGIFFISSCSHSISAHVLEDIVLSCFKKASRQAKVVFRGIQDVDHPLMKGFKEALYLKAIAVKSA